MSALVLMPVGVCTECDAPLREWTIWQPALFRHGGYGATRRHTMQSCTGCGTTREVARSEVNPRNHAVA